ncbi:MAG: hypothetical protein EOP39_31235, partial [Rubrivivax sp.]
MSSFANEAAYDLWAESYPPLPHNPLMRAEQTALLALCPDVADNQARAALLQQESITPTAAGQVQHALVG